MHNTLRKICLALPKHLNDMRVLKTACWLLLAFFAAPTVEAQSISASDWTAAAEKVVRLRPDQFPFLSKPTVAILERLGCRIPQPFYSKEPNNLVTGQFLKRGQTDIALLCERGQTTTLLVLPNMGKGAPLPLAVSSVNNYLQVVGPEEIGFSWGITKIPLKKFMRASEEAGCKWRSDYPPHGIDDAFIEKASSVRYRAHHSWRECAGAD